MHSNENPQPYSSNCCTYKCTASAALTQLCRAQRAWHLSCIGSAILQVCSNTPPCPVLSAYADNAKFYAENGVSFVMGTTGGDASVVKAAAEAGGVYAVVSPQMGKQVGQVWAWMRLVPPLDWWCCSAACCR